MSSRRHDTGFTLPEVLISIVILGLITAVIGAAFVAVIRTTPSAEARTDDARSLLGLTTWLPGDVNSTPRQPTAAASPDWWNIDPAAVSGCTGGPVGTSLLRLRWTETNGATTVYEAGYRIVDNGGWHIVRVSCVVGEPAEAIKLTAGLPDPAVTPVVVSLLTDATLDLVIGASFQVTTLAGDTLTVEAVSESPNETLPTVPVGVTTTSTSTTTTSTSTTTTTTTLAPTTSLGETTTTTSSTTTTSTTTTTTTVPCTASFISVVPSPVENQPRSNGNNDTESQLTQPVIVTVARSGDCTGLTLRYSRKAGFPYPGGQEVSTLFGASSTITFQAISTERWEDGQHPLRLYDAIRSVWLGSPFNLVVT